MPTVFISSTLEDLKPYREKARDAVLKLGWTPIMCEYFAAGGNPPLTTCLERVAPADVVVVIVAHRHGWTPPDQPDGERKSITRLECERARSLGKRVLPFLVDPMATWDGKLYEAFRISEVAPERMPEVAAEVGRNSKALAEFRSWLDGMATRKLFSTPDQLGWDVQHALNEWGKAKGHQPAEPSTDAIRAGYLEWLRRTCESVELLGLDLKDTQNVRLGQVYVPAVTTPRAEESPDQDHLDLLLHRLGEESLYISGAPGAGKTTFCRWVALAVVTGAVPPHPVGVAEEYEEKLPESLCGRFPVLLRLREWTAHHDIMAGSGLWMRKQLESALHRWIDAASPGGLTSALFGEELAAGRCLRRRG